MVLKRQLAPRGTQGSRNPEEEAWGEQTAKKSHLLNANYNNGLSLTIVCWDCQIKPPLAKLSVGHPLEEDTPVKALTVTMTFDMLSPPMAVSQRAGARSFLVVVTWFSLLGLRV